MADVPSAAARFPTIWSKWATVRSIGTTLAATWGVEAGAPVGGRVTWDVGLCVNFLVPGGVSVAADAAIVAKLAQGVLA